MPAGFETCRSEGGKIRTVNGPNDDMGLQAGQYCHVCIDKRGAVHRGEVKTKKAKEAK
ncbi:MAG: hypothetical protein LLG06_19720 [Desulfobacteraceae bacterium]|nr:hypothetical protein [Desulfobacteraceae bacterium]